MSDQPAELRGRWAPDGESELSGRRADLQWLARQLRSVETPLTVFLANVPTGMLPPYRGALRRLVARPRRGTRLRVMRIANDLEIAGEPGDFRILADNLETFARDPAAFGGHLHIEAYPDHAYIAPESNPLLFVAEAE